MNRDWTDFKALYGNIAGAREEFENACESLFRKINAGKHVSQMKVTVGDGGIDIFIGEFGVEPITVIQCKFFLDSFGDSQKGQIRDSFNTAIKSDKYELKEWILCIPRIIDINENSWWFDWKTKKINEFGKEVDFIQIKNGNELLDLLKEHNLYNQYFKIEDSLKIDAIFNAVVPQKIEITKEINPQNVLFNSYSERCESYYFEREIDKSFQNNLKLNNIWVFGESGKGKTAFLNRNIIFNKLNFCYCDLSPITIESSEQVLEEIILNIEVKFQLCRNLKESNLIKQITELLIDKCYKDMVIVIDELSIYSAELAKDIVEKFTRLVIYFNNKVPDGNLKFIISTINNPQYNSNNFSKASEYFQFISCDDWDNDLSKLFDLINGNLNLALSPYKKEVIDAASNSPRILKSIFRKLVLLADINQENISNTIRIVKAEIVN